MECKTLSQNPTTSINHILFALILLHCLNWGYKNRPQRTELCLALSVCSDLFPPLRGSSAQRSPASPAPDQVRACPGVLSTQVVFNEPADLNILYLTRGWFGPCSPAVLAGGSPTAFSTL